MKWIKDNGDKIETNDLEATLKVCVQMGWKQDKGESEEKPKKRGRPVMNKELN